MGLFRKFRSFTAEWGWEEIVPASGSEPSGDRNSFVFTRNGSGKFIVSGGQKISQNNQSWSDLWAFDLSTKTWDSKSTSVSLGNQGYADGNGYLFSGNFGQAFQTLYKTDLATGTVTTLTKSGTTSPPGGATQGFFADPATQTVYASGTDIYGYVAIGSGVGAGGFTKIEIDSVNNTFANTQLATAAYGTTYLQYSSIARYPSNNTMYMLAPSTIWTSSWTLGPTVWLKNDLTANTGWSQETGVTNNAGAIDLPNFSSANNSLVWCPAETKFFVFLSAGHVITYDPASKVMARALFDGQFISAGGQNGNAGAIVVSGSEFFFCKTGGTNARIWKFRRN